MKSDNLQQTIYGFIPIQDKCYVNNDKLKFHIENNCIYVSGKIILKFNNNTENNQTINHHYSSLLGDIVLKPGEKKYILNVIANIKCNYYDCKVTSIEGKSGDETKKTRYNNLYNENIGLLLVVDESFNILKTYPDKIDLVYKYYYNGTAYAKDGLISEMNNTANNDKFTFKIAKNALSLVNYSSIINTLDDRPIDNNLSNRGDELLAKIDDFDLSNLNVSDGKIVKRKYPSINGGFVEHFDWEGTSQLDKMINVLYSQMDIIQERYGVPNTILSTIFSSLLPHFVTQALQLDLNIKTIKLNNYLQQLQLLPNLIQVNNQNTTSNVANKLTIKQIESADLNVTAQLFATQLKGVNTAYEAGISDYPPIINNEEELLSSLTKYKNSNNNLT